MKASLSMSRAIEAGITKAKLRRGLSNVQISRMTGIHESQVSRICRGEFKTLSGNVLQICKLLDVHAAQASDWMELPGWSLIEASVRKVWDRTPEGAERLVRLMETIDELTNSVE